MLGEECTGNGKSCYANFFKSKNKIMLGEFHVRCHLEIMLGEFFKKQFFEIRLTISSKKSDFSLEHFFMLGENYLYYNNINSSYLPIVPPPTFNVALSVTTK